MDPVWTLISFGPCLDPERTGTTFPRAGYHIAPLHILTSAAFHALALHRTDTPGRLNLNWRRASYGAEIDYAEPLAKGKVMWTLTGHGSVVTRLWNLADVPNCRDGRSV